MYGQRVCCVAILRILRQSFVVLVLYTPKRSLSRVQIGESNIRVTYIRRCLTA